MSFRIYTRTGDDGTTGLFGGERVRKDALRIETYGDVDELNSALGLARAYGLQPRLDELIATIQDQLFVLGADLATPVRSAAPEVPRVTAAHIECLEHAIDELEEQLPPLKNFILPGGELSGAALHLARSICRRAERRLTTLTVEEPETGPTPLQYLNRLSDLLFVAARAANHARDAAEQVWKGNPGDNHTNG